MLRRKCSSRYIYSIQRCAHHDATLIKNWYLIYFVCYKVISWRACRAAHTRSRLCQHVVLAEARRHQDRAEIYIAVNVVVSGAHTHTFIVVVGHLRVCVIIFYTVLWSYLVVCIWRAATAHPWNVHTEYKCYTHGDKPENDPTWP